MGRFVAATLAYIVITMALGMTWHFILFPDLYHSLGIYNREPPIVPLGLSSMVLQGLILAYLYPLFRRGGSPLQEGIVFGLIMGVFLFSVSTMATAAKIQVSSMSAWFGIQTAFHALQFVVVGAAIGLIYGKGEATRGLR